MGSNQRPLLTPAPCTWQALELLSLQLSYSFTVIVCTMALLSQPNKPKVWILFQYHMQVNYIGLKIIHVKILPINAASMPEEGGNY